MCRVHNKHHNTAPQDSVYIGRGSPYGNPFVVGIDGDRDTVCDKYEKLLASNTQLVDKVKRDLRGKDLVCFCKPARCHGDTLLRIANEIRQGDSMLEITTLSGDSRPLMGVDVETFPIQRDQVAPDIICVSTAMLRFKEYWKEDAYKTDLTGNSDKGLMLEYFRALLSGEYILVLHNGAMFDLRAICVTFPELIPLVFKMLDEGKIKDTLIREKLLNLTDHGDLKIKPGRTGGSSVILYGLDTLVKEYLDIDISHLKHSEDAWRLNYYKLDGVSAGEYPEEAYEYAVFDAVYVLPIYTLQEEKADVLRAEGIEPFATEDLRTKWGFALSLMEMTGAVVDPEKVAEVRKLMDEVLHIDNMKPMIDAGILIPEKPPTPYKTGQRDHQEECHGHKDHAKYTKKAVKDCDCPVKMSKGQSEKISSKTLKAYIENLSKKNDDIKVWMTDPTERNPEGQISTDKKWFKEFAHLDPTGVLQNYQYRAAQIKIVTDYLVRLEGQDGTPVDMIYTRFDVLKKTGRTSSKKNDLYPSWNCQQVDPRVRPAVKAREGCLLLSVDYSGMELGTLAQYCLDRFGHSKLAEVINNGWDAHSYLGAYIAYKLDEGFATYADGEGWKNFDELYFLFIGLKSSDDDDIKDFFKGFRKVSKPTGLGYPGGLGPATFTTYAKGTFGVDVTLEQAKQLREFWKEVFPEMRDHLKYIGSDCTDFRNSPKRVLNKATGKYEDREVMKYTTPLGLVRSGCNYTACANGIALQSPSAEGALSALYRIVKECYDETIGSVLYGRFFPHMFIHDEILGDVVEDDHIQDVIDRIDYIMVEEMEKITPDVKASTEAALMKRWYKGAESKTIDGKLTTYEPEVI